MQKVVLQQQGCTEEGTLRTIGVDPGATGAIALFVDGQLRRVVDTPTVRDKGRPRVDAAALASAVGSMLLPGDDGVAAFVERVGAMPGQGVTSMFQFGMAAGMVLGVLAALAIPVTLITPAQWKGALRVPKDKGGARARASQLMPSGAHFWPLVKHDGRAEAAMIGLYGIRLESQLVEW